MTTRKPKPMNEDSTNYEIKPDTSKPVPSTPDPGQAPDPKTGKNGYEFIE